MMTIHWFFHVSTPNPLVFAMEIHHFSHFSHRTPPVPAVFFGAGDTTRPPVVPGAAAVEVESDERGAAQRCGERMRKGGWGIFLMKLSRI